MNGSKNKIANDGDFNHCLLLVKNANINVNGHLIITKFAALNAHQYQIPMLSNTKHINTQYPSPTSMLTNPIGHSDVGDTGNVNGYNFKLFGWQNYFVGGKINILMTFSTEKTVTNTSKF